MTHDIRRSTDLKTCFALRAVVFIEEQGVPVSEEIDRYDTTALHFLAMDGDTPVGTARIVLNGTTGKIGRVCVLASHRGTGLGKALIVAALAELRNDAQTKIAVLGAQSQALAFYQKLGFAVVGGEYMDAGIPHFDMEQPL